MHDFGYDVADYCAIDPIFGSLESFDLVMDEAHTKQLKVILDFVRDTIRNRRLQHQKNAA
jgi:alpha-glucosidase